MNEYAVLTAPRTVRLERLLPGPIERVWSYLTDGDKRGEWLASGAMEPRAGGKVEFCFRHFELTPHDEKPPEKYRELEQPVSFMSTVRAYDPPRLLVISWPQSPGEDSEVTFELTPQGKDVLLVITHRNLASRDDLLSVSGGWHTHIGILIDKLDGRVPKPFWSEHSRLEKEYAARMPE